MGFTHPGRSGTGGGDMNHLYYGDNLGVLRDSIADASVDLIYLDPPFNSNASYNVLFKGAAGTASAAQIEAFDDTWHWNDSAEAAFGEVMRGGNAAASTMLRAIRQFLGDNDMMAYLAMMAVRLVEFQTIRLHPCFRAAVTGTLGEGLSTFPLRMAVRYDW